MEDRRAAWCRLGTCGIRNPIMYTMMGEKLYQAGVSVNTLRIDDALGSLLDGVSCPNSLGDRAAHSIREGSPPSVDPCSLLKDFRRLRHFCVQKLVGADLEFAGDRVEHAYAMYSMQA